jgi:predicted nucleic acid-binding protein
VIFLDTNFLILGLAVGSPQNRQLEQWLTEQQAIRVSLMVWTEFLCGPVTPDQVRIATAMVRDPELHLAEDAARAADLFNASGRRRSHLADCLIAATCIRLNAALATLNLNDFRCFEPMGLQLAPS